MRVRTIMLIMYIEQASLMHRRAIVLAFLHAGLEVLHFLEHVAISGRHLQKEFVFLSEKTHISDCVLFYDMLVVFWKHISPHNVPRSVPEVSGTTPEQFWPNT